MSATVTKIEGWRWEMQSPGTALTRTRVEHFEPRADEAVVRVVGCGVCHTDLGYLYDGVRTRKAPPLALGHEIAGEVVAVGERYPELLGKAVIVPAVTPCGECEDCHEGRAAVCKRQIMPGNDVQGGFASHVVVPARGLCVVDAPGALEGRTLGKSGCTLAELSVIADAVSTPYQAICRSGLGEGDLALVIGLGGVGGYAVQIAKALGAHVIGFDLDPARFAALTEHGLDLGVDVHAGEQAAVEAARRFAKEHGLSGSGWRIFECSGSKGGQALAWRLLGPAGWLSVVGFTMDKLEVRLSNLMAFDATAAGNWGCVPELYPEALALVLEGRVAVKPFVQTFPMDEVCEVLAGVHEHRIHKRPVLIPGDKR
ncbi:MAG: 6-hydroxycyclohex-1-ene-1-carbonyl-CoA dehydrogenase [Planctomycetes bacterium]|nr:6-hydroxycyclohex-1-ene-1-carbonyl-CoA dehydrogenase [Planctomycetota bacterium]